MVISKYYCCIAFAIAYFLLIVVTLENVKAQSTRTPTPKATHSPASTQTSTGTSPTITMTIQRPLLVFSTPRPVREEEALATGFSQIPSVFQGIDAYHPIEADLTETELALSSASTLQEAIASVVQILRCGDGFRCTTPVGTGVVVHPSGLILTAYHVLLEDPDDLTSQRYPTFAIAMTDSIRGSPQPLYRASLVAQKDELDIALLAIDQTINGDEIDRNELALPTLTFGNVDSHFGRRLGILGYPIDGSESVRTTSGIFEGFASNGQLIVVDSQLRNGNSGGPALGIENDQMAIVGLVIRGRSTQGRLEQEGLLRAIDQVIDLNWKPRFDQVIGRNTRAVEMVRDGERFVQLSIDLSTFDLVGETLRLLFYVTDAFTSQPWQPPDMDEPLAIWADLSPDRLIDAQTVQLTISTDVLGTTPDRLRFYGMLWDRGVGQSMWASKGGIQIEEEVVAMMSETDLGQQQQQELLGPSTPTVTPTATERPTDTRTSTPTFTSTQQPTMTPTVNQTATADAVETAAIATFEALFTPTPTVDLIAVRLTEIAVTATAMARVPTVTHTPTSTNTPAPTPTKTPTPTPKPPQAGEVRKFGGIPFVYVPEGPFIMGSEDNYSDERPQSRINVESFWIMQIEVTNHQY
ncbi:trypsin-like peptidase domain-containing protein [Chloroflexi bacterium TSY]|nr:trypsin-like peptidase domain-containing protein [Chloroflexi bacterium TSY]